MFPPLTEPALSEPGLKPAFLSKRRLRIQLMQLSLPDLEVNCADYSYSERGLSACPFQATLFA